MFYKYKSPIYTGLIILAMVISFLFGKMSGKTISGTVVSGRTVSGTVVSGNIVPAQQHRNYNQELEVTGGNYALKYTVINAALVDKNKMNFSLKPNQNNNVLRVHVTAKNDKNTVFEVKPLPSNTDELNYTVTFDDSTENITLLVYPLSPDLANNPQLDINTVPFRDTMLNVGLIRNETINKIGG